MGLAHFIRQPPNRAACEPRHIRSHPRVALRHCRYQRRWSHSMRVVVEELAVLLADAFLAEDVILNCRPREGQPLLGDEDLSRRRVRPVKLDRIGRRWEVAKKYPRSRRRPLEAGVRPGVAIDPSPALEKGLSLQ